MKHEPMLERLRELLAKHKGEHQHIAQASGVPQTTVSRIYRGAIPRLDTADKLLKWFDAHERKGRRRAKPKSRDAAPLPATLP